MRMTLSVLLVTFILGVAASALLTPAVHAGDNPCDTRCSVTYTCSGITTDCPPNWNHYTKCYTWYPDPLCMGAYTCGCSDIGCGPCQW